MKLKKINRPLEIVPEFNGNRNEKAENKFTVTLNSYPSGAQIGVYKRFRFKDGATEIVYADAEMMVTHIKSLNNFYIGEDVIDTPVKLCDYKDDRLYDLIVELRTILLKSSEDLTEGES